MNRTLLLLCSVILLCLATTARAANITATSCSSSDVQAAIDSAATSDTVIVPPGNCTWTSTVTIASKGITLAGAGINQTNITDQGASGSALTITGASGVNVVTVSGFTFVKSTSHANGMINISGPLFGINAFRIHHNRFVSATSGSRGVYIIGVYGLIDHNTVDVTATSGSIQSFFVEGASVATDAGHTPWKQPLTLGTVNAVYIEDNTITYDPSLTGNEDAIDAGGGARFVIRHNFINNDTVGFHGTDSGGRRSPVSHEVYNNVFTNNSTTRIRGGTVRGGTGVWFNNTYQGSVPTGWFPISLLAYRACGDNFPANTSAWQLCDGTNWELGSATLSDILSRTCSVNGGFRFDGATNKILAATDGTYTKYFDGAGRGGYPCRDQPGYAPGQVNEPIYAWNNTGGVIISGVDVSTTNCHGFGLANYILSGREYVNNGSTPKPGYTAYTYPYPFPAVQSNTTPPNPPAGLSVH